MSDEPGITIAGSGVAASATALALRARRFEVTILHRRRVIEAGLEAVPASALLLLDALGAPDLARSANGFESPDRDRPATHFDRRSLAAAFLQRAVERGAVVTEIERLPAGAEIERQPGVLVDATGRVAAWSRPVSTDGHEVAHGFDGPPVADPALRTEQGDGWWGYRLGVPDHSWTAIVTQGTASPASDQIAGAVRALGLDPDRLTARGRRSARVQRAVCPVTDRRIAVGDAALAHDPIAGAGIRFALTSALAAAAVISTWVREPTHAEAATQYYAKLVTTAHRRHLAARAAARQTVVDEPTRSPGRPPVVRFAGTIVEAPVLVDGFVRPSEAVRDGEGDVVRWLGSYDLLRLAAATSDPIPVPVLIAVLQSELSLENARRVVDWSVRRGVLAPVVGPRPA